MFKFFKKSTATYPTDSRWMVYKGQYNGSPLFVRRNVSASQLIGSSEYRFRIGVAIPLQSPDESGLPGNAEMEELNKVEDLLALQLEAERNSLYVLSITTAGMREFVFYSRNPEAAEKAIGEVALQVGSHKLQHYAEEDGRWSVYKEFSK